LLKLDTNITVSTQAAKNHKELVMRILTPSKLFTQSCEKIVASKDQKTSAPIIMELVLERYIFLSDCFSQNNKANPSKADQIKKTRAIDWFRKDRNNCKRTDNIN
jgi:hypothetical protein